MNLKDNLIVGNSVNNVDIHDSITKVISESVDLITALESVGSMYGIPSSHVLEDDTLNSIKVVDDTIIAPSKPNPINNTNAIMCSIGSVLDHISQRIDDKIEDFQYNNMCNRGGEQSSPSKGNVLSRNVDANGNEVVSYDSGIVDGVGHSIIQKSRYFTDEDDLSASIEPPTSTNDSIPETTNVADTIQESAVYMELMSGFGDTRNLGHDLLQSQGFDFVKPVSSIYQEAKADVGSSKGVLPEDIKYMRFDNSNIVKAIKFMNLARAEQSGAKRGELDISKLINDQNYQKAIDCLNKQFNARITVRHFGKQYGSNLYTCVYNDIKNNLSISKAKGFQLNGLPIEIHVLNTALDEDAPTDISLFGQNVISVFLHEIFHNICGVFRSVEAVMNGAYATSMAIASSIRDGKKKRIFLTNYVDTMNAYCGLKLSKMKRRCMVKYLATISSIQDEKGLLTIKNNLENAGSEAEVNKYTDELIAYYEKAVKKTKKHISPTRLIMPSLMILLGAGLVVFSKVTGKDEAAIEHSGKTVKASLTTGSISQLGTGLMLGGTIKFIYRALFIAGYNLATNMKGYKDDKEEFYCDMFAAMYKLPVTFFISTRRGPAIPITSNQIDIKRLQKIKELELDIYKLSFIKYPTMIERNAASVIIAKKLLADESSSMDKSIKEYLEWIVDNYSSTLDTDVREIYNTATFDPATAEDLDTHLGNLIKDNNVTVTESYKLRK